MKILQRGTPPTLKPDEWWIGRQAMCTNCDTVYVVESTKDLYTKPNPSRVIASSLCPVCPEKDFSDSDRMSLIYK